VQSDSSKSLKNLIRKGYDLAILANSLRQVYFDNKYVRD